ncbi:MAG: IS30 family transposase [Bacilli bacterium]
MIKQKEILIIEMVFKLQAKTAKEVVNKFNEIKMFMKKNFNKVFKSITIDNGSDFSDFLEINKDTKIYFCHLYCSGEKGTNEKSNSMIRYFIPKGKSIGNYSYSKKLHLTF